MPEEAGDTEFYRTQYELLKSRTLAERVVEQLNLRQRSAREGRSGRRRGGRASSGAGRRRATRRPPSAPAPDARAAPTRRRWARSWARSRWSPSAIRGWCGCYFDSPDPRLAADALNALAQNFIAVNLERRYEASSYAKTFLEEKLAQTKARLEDSERALVEFQREPADHQRRRQAERARADAGRLQRGGGARPARIASRPRRCTASSRTTRSPRRRWSTTSRWPTLREQRTKLQVEYQDLLRIYKPAFPKMQQLKAAIDEIDKKIKEESDIVRRSIEGTYNVAVQQEASVRGQARGGQEGRARPAGPQHPLQHPEARGRHQPLALRRPAAAAEGSRRRRAASAPTT